MQGILLSGQHFSILGIVALIVFILIIAKGGGLVKAFGFLIRYLFLPGIMGLLCGLAAKAFTGSFTIGVVIGGILGLIMAFKFGKNAMR